jgi:hypothetical protein
MIQQAFNINKIGLSDTYNQQNNLIQHYVIKFVSDL